MSLASCWSQAVSYLNSADISFVSNVFQYPEVQTPEWEMFPSDNPGATTGCLIWSWIQHGTEIRVAAGPDGPPPNGQKMVSYQLHLNAVLRAKYQTKGEGDPVQLACADNTTFIDSLIAAVRYSRNAGGAPVGAGDAIWQWGMGPGEKWSDDITWTSDGPAMLQGAGVAGIVEIRTRFEIAVIEWVNA